MFLRPNYRLKDGKDHTYWSLVETVRTVDGPRQRTLCYLGELNGSAQARWLKSVEVFNEQGEAEQLKLFPSHIEVPGDDPQVARVLVNRVRLERTREFGAQRSGQCSALIADEGAGFAIYPAERGHRAAHDGWTRDPAPPDHRTNGRTEITTAPTRLGAT